MLNKRTFSFLALLLLLLGGFSSCMTKKKLARLKNEYEVFRIGLDSLGNVKEWKERDILPGDKITLNINTESINTSQVEIFNFGKDLSYVVADDSTITIPLAGKVKIAGLNRSNAALRIKNEMAKFIKNPYVSIQPLEVNIIVMGQVDRQQVVSMPEKEANILRALTLAGGLNQFSKRDSVFVIRESDKVRKLISIDFRDAKTVYASEGFKLQNNDIVMIKPNDYFYKQVRNSENSINLGRITPVTTILGIFFLLIPIYSILSR
jgi:polysaccharide export outer membrane protein